MIQLIIGLTIFLSVQCIPLFPTFKAYLITKLGKFNYLIIFIVGSVIGLTLICYHFKYILWQLLWTPPAFSRFIAQSVMPFVFMILMLALFSTQLGYKLKKPLAIAIILWSSVHLLANGELKTTVLFGAFLVYGLMILWFGKMKLKPIGTGLKSYLWDVIAIILGLGLFPLIMLNHFYLFGMPV